MSECRFQVDEQGWEVYGISETANWLNAADIQLKEAFLSCRKFDLAIDIGANIGIYTHIMARKFAKVIAFEPFWANVACFWRNRLTKFPNAAVELHEVALSDQEGHAAMKDWIGISSHVIPGDTIRVATLDSFGFEPDFIKIDAEGYDLKVLRGARETMELCRTVILVENKSDKNVRKRHPDWYGPDEIQNFMEGLGYQCIKRFGIDWLWVKQ